MKILLTGASGQAGRAIINASTPDFCLIPLTREVCDITNEYAVRQIISYERPDYVIHCAAYTSVDLAQTHKDRCYAVNVLGTRNIAVACNNVGATLLLMSTDYVFPGTGTLPYETDDIRSAVNYYGYTKMLAEDIVFRLDKYCIVRTSWMFGDGYNFVRTICRLARKNKDVRVICDQIGSPTYAADLAQATLEVVRRQLTGIYHITNEGYCSWADLAKEAFRVMNIPAEVIRIFSSEYGSPINRPKNSRLSKDSLDKVGIARLPSWQDGLRRYIEKYGDVL